MFVQEMLTKSQKGDLEGAFREHPGSTCCLKGQVVEQRCLDHAGS